MIKLRRGGDTPHFGIWCKGAFEISQKANGYNSFGHDFFMWFGIYKNDKDITFGQQKRFASANYLRGIK